MSIAKFTTNTAQVAEGIDLYYADSGPVVGSDTYTTLVVIHGSAFTGDTFYKLLPLGARHNLRIVIIHRRDYRGSTKYTDAELADLQGGKKIFLERLAQQTAEFLVQFAVKHNIPKISADGTTGGIALMGWSMGNATSMAVFGQADAIPKKTLDTLTPYMKNLILYDPPYLTFGYPLPSDHKSYDPWTDPDCKTGEALFDNFSYWVSSYYDHPNVESKHINGLDFRKRTSTPPPTVIANMTAEELVLNLDNAAAVRSELAMYIEPMQSTLRAQVQRALFNPDIAQTLFPGVRVAHISGTKSNWHCVWGFMEAKRVYDAHVAHGDAVRPITFINIEGANHFVHWDAPEHLLSATIASFT